MIKKLLFDGVHNDLLDRTEKLKYILDFYSTYYEDRYKHHYFHVRLMWSGSIHVPIHLYDFWKIGIK